MRRGRILIYIGLILILGLIAAFVIFSRLGQTPGGGTAQVPGLPNAGQQEQVVATTDVVITTQRISRGDEITEGLVQLVAIPQDRVVDGMFTSLDQVIGQNLFSRFSLEPGIFLTRSMVADFSDLGPSGADVALLIDPGMVAVSLPINRLTSVAYGLRRGDHVNVIVTMSFLDLDTQFQTILPNNTSSVLAPGPYIVSTDTTTDAEGNENNTTVVLTDELFNNLTAQVVAGGILSPLGRLELDPTLGQPFYVVPSEAQRARSVSQTLVQGALVLQMGTFPLGEPGALPTPTPVPAESADAEDPNAQPTPVPAPDTPDIITIVVSPQDAVTLNYLMVNGARLSLAMRGVEDDSRAETEAVTLQFLLDQYNIQNPAKLPYGMFPGRAFPTLDND